MINEILNAVIQILVFSLIPFLVYLAKTKKIKGFFNYIGLKKSTKKANLLAIPVSLIFLIPPLCLSFFNDDFRKIMTDPATMTGKFRTMGFGAEPLIIILTAAIFKTALAEEILFRGFIAKRLISKMGYLWGNVIQSFIFGLLHLLLFIMITGNVFFLIFIMIFASLSGYLCAYLNEKQANGSIVPGWIAHGLANIISYSVIGFLI